MTVETAKAILEVAKAGGYLDEEVPEDEEQLLRDGQFYLTHAKAAVESGQDDEVIRKIVELGEAGAQADGYVEETTTPRDLPAEPEPSRPAEVVEENLPIPREIAGDPPQMPFDLTEQSDKQIRHLAGAFNACLGRVTWLLSQALDDELALKHLREDVFERALLAEAETAEKEGAKTTKDDRAAAARQNEEYKTLDADTRAAESKVRKYKALKEIYQGNIDRLSREATLRDDEYRRTGGRS